MAARPQAAGKSICVHNLGTGVISWWLDGHSATVTATAFATHRPAMLVSVSEDRTFVVWDLEKGTSIFTSCIESPTSFVSIAVDTVLDRFAVGSIDGTIRFFTFRDYTRLHTMDYAGEAARRHRRFSRGSTPDIAAPAARSSRVVTGRGSTTKLPAAVAATLGDGSDDLRNDGVLLQLAFVVRGQDDGGEAGTPPAAGIATVLIEGQVLLFVGTTTSVGLVDSCSMQVLSEVSLGDQLNVPVESDSPRKPELVRVAGAYVFGSAESTTMNSIHTVLTCGAFDQLVELASLRVSHAPRLSGHFESSGGATEPQSLSMLSGAALLDDSPLHAVLSLVKKAPSQKKSGGGGSARGSKGSTSAPVTFGRKIKSSGYAAPSKPAKMFQPKTDFGGSSGRSLEKRASKSSGDNIGIDPARLASKGSSMGGPRVSRDGLATAYPIDCHPPVTCAGTFPVSAGPRPTPVHSVRIGPAGRSVAALATDGTVSVVKIADDLATSSCRTFAGHAGPAIAANWSADNKYLLTASRDEILVWSLASKSREPVLNMGTRQHNFKPKEGEGDGNRPFGKGTICSAQFYYMDKFVLVGVEGALSMYKYSLDATVDDLKRLQTKSRYREVVTLAHPGAKSITAIAAANNFYSYLVLTAGSDRSINVFDMNVAQSVLQIPEAQSRAAHLIELNRGSRYAEMPPDSLNLFFTAAMTDGILMWDLRVGNVVRRFASHRDRATPVGLDFSPCGRYVATGSEDRHAYVYDVRTGTSVSKLSGHTDVVTDVSFRPQRPGLITSCVDGKIRAFE